MEYYPVKGKTPDIIHISGDVYAVAYAADGDDGWLVTVTIATNGQITNSVIDTFGFDAVSGKDSSIISIADDVYAIANEGNGSDGFLVTVTIATDGQWHRVGRYVNIYLVVF